MGSIKIIKDLLAKLENNDSQLTYRAIYQEYYLVPPVLGNPGTDPIVRLQRFDSRIQPFNEQEKACIKALAKMLKVDEYAPGVRVRALDKNSKYQDGVILTVDEARRRARISWDSKPNRSWRNLRDLTVI